MNTLVVLHRVRQPGHTGHRTDEPGSRWKSAPTSPANDATPHAGTARTVLTLAETPHTAAPA
ncbi:MULTISPECIES: hypothetical protein [Streptomyces]|uniref:Uncharacterized protein n=1 Tax=Streptomyces kaempferi TaxID=333725 RepID=A0ABW3XV76_9ACTN|nr:hypothetical protein [Streptomyces sp. NBC_01571]MCX4580829.1 hypothetical protein [Streptomyces sp. NBC_01571]